MMMWSHFYQKQLQQKFFWLQLNKRQTYIGIIAVSIIVLVTTTTSLSISATPSLPYHYYLTVKGWPAARGDLVAIDGHTTCYHPEPLLYVKRLIGLPSDVITVQDGVMQVADYRIKPLRTHTSAGQPLTASTALAVPDGHVLVVGEHPQSFDSRYQEFGFVDIKHIQGKTWGWGSWQ